MYSATEWSNMKSWTTNQDSKKGVFFREIVEEKWFQSGLFVCVFQLRSLKTPNDRFNLLSPAPWNFLKAKLHSVIPALQVKCRGHFNFNTYHFHTAIIIFSLHYQFDHNKPANVQWSGTTFSNKSTINFVFEDGESSKEVSRMWVSSNQVIQGLNSKTKSSKWFFLMIISFSLTSLVK